ncbi:acetylornithine transaminase [Thiohalophilus sp.]|uniref:acetylornithine transaminase n=1 Tax=Thiohalophilus sp. TaxID=3028392 RepID=UPI002ACDD8E5|nr:acetylornithine transaminase [Thiohalophilus sp.]MDZ7802998.1 acetylornithine transaminase [Thiohalophilus sp.]
MADHLMHNYAPLPVTFVRGEGAWLWDTEERAYLDALSGVAVCGLGHAHPAIADAIAEQARTLVHTSNWYHIARQEALAAKLTAIAGMDNAFFCNSGAEANEAAIKLARLHGRQKQIETPTIVVMDGSFHGRTMATLTATGNPKVQAGFEPLVPGFVHVPYNDVSAIEQLAAQRDDIVAIMVEPITGEGGIRIPTDDYLPQLRGLCDAHDWLLIADEIQTGMGRTGQWFAFQHSGIQPDIITLAKGLGNGVPIGACLARGRAADLFQPGQHGSTYGGNPLVCAAALAVIETIEREHLAARAGWLGQHMLNRLYESLAKTPGVVECRGKGLMLAVELDRPCGELMQQALDKGLLINVTAGNVLRLLPPLILSDEEAEQIINGVSELIQGFLA